MKLTPEEERKLVEKELQEMIHPMGAKMKQRADLLISLVESAGSEGITRKRLEGELYLKGVAKVRTTREHLKFLVQLDELILLGGLYYTPDNYELHEWKRALEDRLLGREEEEPVRVSQNITHTNIPHLLSKKSLPSEGGES